MNANNLHLGQTVYHLDLYHGREPLKIVGIRETEIELEGDYSGGTHNVCQKSWLPLEGIRYGRQRTPEEEAEWQEWCKRNKEIVKNGGVAMLPQHFKSKLT